MQNKKIRNMKPSFICYILRHLSKSNQLRSEYAKRLALALKKFLEYHIPNDVRRIVCQCCLDQEVK